MLYENLEKMDLETAIVNLASLDETTKNNAIEICSSFQTLQFFDCSKFSQLSSRDSSQSFRYFAYNSLIQVMKNNFDAIPMETKESIISLFPFHTNDDINDPVYYSIVSKCVAAYFAFLGNENDIADFMNVYNQKQGKYFASFITYFVLFLFDKDFPEKRISTLSKFVFENIVKHMKKMLFTPLLQMNPMDPDFDVFVANVCAIHEMAPVVIQLFLCDDDAEKFYSHLAEYVWIPYQKGSIETIFEVIFENLAHLPQTVCCMAFFLNQAIQNHYSPLFSFDLFDESEIPHRYFLFNNLLVRIPLIFNILNSCNFEQYGPFLEIVITLFKSSCPSLISETATQLLLFLKSLQKPIIPNFFEYYETHIRALIEVTLPLLQAFFGSSPCVVFDHRWCQTSTKTSLVDLIKYMVELFDELHVVPDLIKLIQIDGVESQSFASVLRILIDILGENNEKLKNEISDDAFNCTIHLLSSINTYPSQIQNKVCKLLIKFVPYLEKTFDDTSILNNFFSQLLNLFIDARPSAFDPFTNFFNQFVNLYGMRVKIPIQKLKEVHQGNPCYYTAVSLITKYNNVSEDSNVLSTAIRELEWFITSFKPNDSGCMRRVTTKLARNFEILSKIKVDDAMGNQQIPSEIYNKIGSYLIRSNEVLLRAGEKENGIPIGQYLTLLNQFAPAISHFASITPQQYLDNLNQLRPPTVFTQAVPQWVARIAFPIVTTLSNFSPQSQIVNKFAECVTQTISRFVDEKADIVPSEASSDIHGIIKKLIVQICDLTPYINEDLTIKALKICLKYDNFKAFYQVAHAIEEKGINVLSALWKILVKKKDNQSVDKISEILLTIYEKNGGSVNIFSRLPDVSQSEISNLNSKLPNSTAQKTKKRIFKSFLLGVTT